jgi:hypothetical protein
VVDPLTLQVTAYLKLDGRCIALTFHPSKPLAFISLDTAQQKRSRPFYATKVFQDQHLGLTRQHTLAF